MTAMLVVVSMLVSMLAERMIVVRLPAIGPRRVRAFDDLVEFATVQPHAPALGAVVYLNESQRLAGPSSSNRYCIQDTSLVCLL